jgi:hypothetical protein
MVIIYRAYDTDVPAGQFCRIFATKKVKKGLKIGDSILLPSGSLLGRIVSRKWSNLYLEPAEVSFRKKEHVVKLVRILKELGFKVEATQPACKRLLLESAERSGYGQ